MSESDLSQLANDLRVACQIISRRVRFDGTSGIAPHQASVLGAVRDGAMTVGELAANERVSAPSMTRTVNCLVEQGLVVKVASSDDRRQILVQITETGLAALQRAVADRDGWMLSLLERLDPAKVAQLRELAPLLVEVARA